MPVCLPAWHVLTHPWHCLRAKTLPEFLISSLEFWSFSYYNNNFNDAYGFCSQEN